MHSTDGKEVTFHHNGDYSGDVLIVVQAHKVAHYESTSHTSEHYEIEIPFNDLKMLVAEYVRGEKVDRLEQAEDDEVFGL
jgi:hypothetical protein